LCLDRYAALALKVHRIQHLLGHLAVTQASAHLDKTISQGGLAVIDMGDDRKIADALIYRHGWSLHKRERSLAHPRQAMKHSTGQLASSHYAKPIGTLLFKL
jgi:hypothetical protein